MAVPGNEYSRSLSLPSAHRASASDLPMALRSPLLSLYPTGCLMARLQQKTWLLLTQLSPCNLSSQLQKRYSVKETNIDKHILKIAQGPGRGHWGNILLFKLGVGFLIPSTFFLFMCTLCTIITKKQFTFKIKNTMHFLKELACKTQTS